MAVCCILVRFDDMPGKKSGISRSQELQELTRRASRLQSGRPSASLCERRFRSASSCAFRTSCFLLAFAYARTDFREDFIKGAEGVAD